EPLLHDAVLQGVEADRRGTPAAADDAGQVTHEGGERAQLVVHRDAQGLERARRRMDVARPRFAGDGPCHELRKLRGILQLAFAMRALRRESRMRAASNAAGSWSRPMTCAPASSSASACPPAPSVPSRNTFPGAGASRSTVSRRSTVRCSNDCTDASSMVLDAASYCRRRVAPARATATGANPSPG